MARIAIREELHCTHVVGVPHAGKPFAQPFADYYFPRPVLLEMEKVGDAIGGFVGQVPESGYVLGIDDLITKAKSKLPVIERVRAAGMAIRDFVVLIDRGQGGGEELAGHGVALHSGFDVQQVIGLAYGLGSISVKSYETVRGYLSHEKPKR